VFEQGYVFFVLLRRIAFTYHLYKMESDTIASHKKILLDGEFCE
jgi:hypothetical protein